MERSTATLCSDGGQRTVCGGQCGTAPTCPANSARRLSQYSCSQAVTILSAVCRQAGRQAGVWAGQAGRSLISCR